ncbi:MAG: CBS domain-containing protein [Saprospiraceae bacterium]|nr:CBS domain-containing protein [Saprospiraceae bacterium]
MLRIKDVLYHKGYTVHSIANTATVYSALEQLIDKNIGSLVVLDGQGKICGLFTERDYSRKVALLGRSSKETQVSEIMSTNAPCVSPENLVSEGLSVMTANFTRHLPVLTNDQLVGIVSIGDLVKSIIQSQEDTIESLRTYIHA